MDESMGLACLADSNASTPASLLRLCGATSNREWSLRTSYQERRQVSVRWMVASWQLMVLFSETDRCELITNCAQLLECGGSRNIIGQFQPCPLRDSCHQFPVSRSPTALRCASPSDVSLTQTPDFTGTRRSTQACIVDVCAPPSHARQGISVYSPYLFSRCRLFDWTNGVAYTMKGHARAIQRLSMMLVDAQTQTM
jgi:hypothetical protein